MTQVVVIVDGMMILVVPVIWQRELEALHNSARDFPTSTPCLSPRPSRSRRIGRERGEGRCQRRTFLGGSNCLQTLAGGTSPPEVLLAGRFCPSPTPAHRGDPPPNLNKGSLSAGMFSGAGLLSSSTLNLMARTRAMSSADFVLGNEVRDLLAGLVCCRRSEDRGR